MRTIEGRYGPISYYGKDEYVGRSIHNYGEFSPSECDFIVSLCDSMGSANRLVLDIGANIGAVTQAIAHAGYEVIAFEPQPAIFNLLQKNFSGSAFNCALGNIEGVTSMPRVDYSRKGNFGGLGIGQRSPLGIISVAIKKLDSFEYQRVGLIKIDVEGFELEVLKGGEVTIMRDRPVMYIENDRVEKSTELLNWLEAHDYSIEPHEPPLYSENNFFGLKENIWDRNYVSKNIICRPC